ncbi:sulfofructose kinase-like isoform X1 [Phoenix dactylifera]|uniref:Sulfofructose kinase-like isoform X1 n=1 Tax=Phoenix dactylifera TaxID=42345 RepID=A0A8B7D0W2_PHODC|nr:sulfofructose kinase-like isoform X1 [Phoenix dactylifera]
MAETLSIAVPPLPWRRIVVGCGMAAIDFVATVDAFPKPDDKIRSKRLKVLGGGNAGNALTCAARLGLTPRLISKVADDTHGGYILAELEADGIDISNVVICNGGTSTFSYVIVDNQMKTRTCIYTPVYPAMVPEDLPRSSLLSALDEAKLVYFDGWLHRTALVIAQQAAEMNIPILIDAETNKSGLNGLLDLASYIICSEKFPQEWTSIPSITYALVSILLRFPHVRFAIATLGEKGCIMLERSIDDEGSDIDETDVENLLESLKMRVDKDNVLPSCVSSECMRLCAPGVGTISGRLLLGTAEIIPSSEIVDTTGAGDAFIGAILYALCAEMPPEKMLPFAAQVAALCCRALGARTGLPRRMDPRLAPFLQ